MFKDEETGSRQRVALEQASIPIGLWKLKLPECGKRGKELRSLLAAGEYGFKKAKKQGLCFSGTGNKRIDLFHAFIKEYALTGENVYLITLHKLVIALKTNNSDFLVQLDRVRALAISYFYDGSIHECPYSFWERSAVEDFLRDKLQSGQHVYLSSSDCLDGMNWWSVDFREELKSRCGEVLLGKNNRD